LLKKSLAIAVVVLFLGISVIPVVVSNTPTNRIIYVDDEGDGDYTTIEEAVNNSNPGDIINVYSGEYYVERRFTINKKNITLKGIPFELGIGNDSGKPLVKRNTSNPFWLIVESDWTTIEGFSIYNGFIHVYGSNNTICSNTLQKVSFNPWPGDGILIEGDFNIISENFIKNNYEVGIRVVLSNSTNISNNIVENCVIGIVIEKCKEIIVFHNEFRENNAGINIWLFKNRSALIIVSMNNFIGNKNQAVINTYFPNFFQSIKFDMNYWDDWRGFGSKYVFGSVFLGLIGFPNPFGDGVIIIPIRIPWICFDHHPAQEPYDISMPEV